MSRMLRDIAKLKVLANAASGSLEPTVYGVIDRVDKIDGELVPNIIRRWEGTIGDMKPTDKEPTVLLVPKLEPFILKTKKYKCFFGGRGGMKTVFAQNVLTAEIHSTACKNYVLRETMKSLKDSIFAGIENTVKKSDLSGFISVPSQWEIRNINGGKFVFGGLSDVVNMKGAAAFKRFLMEEAEKTKQHTIDVLGPTLRDMPGAELWYLWNTGSSQDPMSKEFITPYQAQLDKTGFYEDDYHMIVKLTFEDNPWFKWDESLQGELEKDREKVKRGIMSQARFDGIWYGKFNDDVANSVIREDWFKACIDAHKKLGIEKRGPVVCAADPSDVGTDPFGYVARQGIVVFGIDEIEGDNGNRKMDMACQKAILDGCDSFGYDADGLGATLRDNVSKSFGGKGTKVYAYKGSSAIHNPEAAFKSDAAAAVNGNKVIKNKDALRNKKSQNIVSFADRVFRTWEAVVEGKYHNPDDLISFDSETIKPEMLEKLKAEACKTPIKPEQSGLITFYTKPELRKGIIMPDGKRLVIPSPNLFDAMVISWDKDCIITHTEEVDINALHAMSSRSW